MGDGVTLVSSALEVTKVVKEILKENDIERDEKVKPVYRYYTSDSVEKFESLGSAILESEIHSAEKVDIEKY
jgi:glutamate racemase